jgi:aldehyde:ferredoxin oxidoreductase
MSQGGYHGQYLVVNLTDRTFSTEKLSDEITSNYLGGRGIATKLLYDSQEAQVDPLSPHNNLIIFTGPVAGTNTPGSSRLMFTTKSPLSNAVNTTSMGGSFPNAFKATGFDGLLITGRSEDPVWLHLTPDGVTFHSAEELWGLKTTDTEDAITKHLGDKCKVACIGPAGENQVLFAAIVSATRTASRGGAGTVMGAKNLKALAVSGEVKPPIANKQAFDEVIKKIREDQKENPSVVGMQMNGTAGLISVVNAMGALPTRNFQTGTFEGAEDIAGSTITEKNRVKGFACASCPVGCSLIAEIKSGDYKGTRSEGPEYESTVMLGSNCGIADLDTIIAANYLCDEYGLDTISAGNVVGFLMECYEKGLVTDTDLGGIKPTFGNGKALLSLLELIAKKEGIGARLAQGVARLSQEIPGSESFAMHVKGLELAAYDPRGVFGQGLSYAIAPRGGEHGRGGYMIVEFFMPDVDLYTHEGKAQRATQMAEDAAMYDLSSLCSFNFVPIPLIPPLISAVTGKDYTEDSLREITRRVITLERKFNIREGFSRKDDTLPPRLLNEPLPDGMAEGKKVEGLDLMLDDYYAIRGWDNNGVPLN